jgi:branched-chain amino acid aminotransferase
VHSLVHHNGRVVPLAEVRLSPGQSGLLSGWGIFTTIRIYGGKPFAFERHWKRLHRDAERIRLPFDFTSKSVLAALEEVIQANQVASGCARVYFIRNKAGFWQSDEPFPPTDLLIYTNKLPSFSRPCSLTVQAHGRHAAHPLAGVKVTSWLQNVCSLEQAHAGGFDEVILLNERGEVAECTSANVFCVRGEAVETPPLSSGCLAGITREVLLEIGPDSGLRVTERTLALEDLHQADEVFVSSTSRELLPVGRIDDHHVPQADGPVTARLAQLFSQFVMHSLAESAPHPGGSR